MKILIYSPNSFIDPHHGVLLDEAEKYIREGHEVIFLFCDHTSGRCSVNSLANPSLCQSCKIQHRFLQRKLSQKVGQYFISSFYESKTIESFEYKKINDIFDIYYKGIDIGSAVISTYVTLTRNLDPEITPDLKKMMDGFLQSSIILANAAEKAIDMIKPDRICLFNGRLMETRPVLRIGRQKNIDTFVYEVIGTAGKYKSVCFENTLPHDIEYNTQEINNLWDNSPLSTEEKERIASNFFILRKQGKAAGDKAYTANQEVGKLPPNWDKSKTNIIIFNSSEDEFFAVGDEYNEKLFSSQIDGIRFILESNKHNSDIHFYLRIHPNLSNVKYKYHQELQNFRQYPNCDVIEATSPISTYTLIDHAEKVVVFGSTVGLEACYWGKPTILLGSTFYKNLDVAYYPKSLDELQQLLPTSLTPKNRLGALKYAYFTVGDRGENYTYINFNKGNFKEISKYKTLCGSTALYYFFFVFSFTVTRKLVNFFKRNRIPVNER